MLTVREWGEWFRLTNCQRMVCNRGTSVVGRWSGLWSVLLTTQSIVPVPVVDVGPRIDPSQARVLDLTQKIILRIGLLFGESLSKNPVPRCDGFSFTVL